MVWMLIALSMIVLAFENLLDILSLQTFKNRRNRVQCLRRLIRRHVFMAAFFSWVLWLLEMIASLNLFLGILLVLGGLSFLSEILMEKSVFVGLKQFGWLMIMGLLIASAGVLFFDVMAPWLLGLLVSISVILLIAVFDRLHGKLIHRFARVVPYYHRMDDAEYLQDLSFNEWAYMLDLQALDNTKNAMIVGLFPPRRLYVSKALLRSMRSVEVEGIVAHEIGHIRRGHIFKRLGLALIALAVLIVYGMLVFQADQSASVTYTSLFSGWILMGSVFRSLLAYFMQHQEFEADFFAAEAGKADALMHALKRLSRQENEQGHPLRALLHETHPSIKKRLERLKHQV